jgi:hypothetical protein
MKKENIYVVIDSEEKRLRAIQILSDAEEKIYRESKLFETYNSILHFIFSEVCNHWEAGLYGHKTEITLDQLEQLLLPKQGYICPQTKIQCDDECCVSAEDCHITSSLASGMVDCDELKQEWQQKRMYSEEDLREAFKQSRQALIFEKDMPPVYNDFEEWFEQFKKK